MRPFPTPHNDGIKKQIAETVLMQGDPRRTEYIAKNFLTDVIQFNKVRNAFGYTGYYKGNKISVMAHGMGMPSIGIYTYELFNFYDVQNIIRTGSAGGITKQMGLMDIVLAAGACTDSHYADQYNLPGSFAPIADFGLLKTAYETAQEQLISVEVGNVISTDVFYNADKHYNKKWAEMGVLAVEMEAAALYMNAAQAGKKALTMCTISDNLVTDEKLSTAQREQGFNEMIKLALETAIKL